ncbi:MAG: DnaJ domain-containing protein [Cyanobacteria bacterium P01_D01_bin.73]
MSEQCFYAVLQITADATAAEIKSAYRNLVKRHHPDINGPSSNHDQIARINAAYEVLGDEQRRRQYDAYLRHPFSQYFPNPEQEQRDRAQRTRTATRQYQQRKTGQSTDADLDQWIKLVYRPINRLIDTLTDSLEGEIVELSADPFDDELMEKFCEYLDKCGDRLSQARHSLASMPNPSVVAGVAAHLYYCLERIGDGLDELAYFPMNYDETRLHAGQEMFRTAGGLHYEARNALESLGL